MERNDVHIDEMEKNALRQNALQYMPRNLGDTEAQRQILQMIVEAIPPVAHCMEQADVQIWPKVASQELSMSQAIAQCAYQTDRLIAANIMESLSPENLPEQTLLQAWIALDYYAYVLKAEYSANIRFVQNSITDILLNGKKNSEPEDMGVTQPVQTVEEYSATQPVQNADDCGVTQPVLIPEETPEFETISPDNTPTAPKKPKSHKGAVIIIMVAAILVAAALAFSLIFSKPNQAERMIKAIGTVTLDSAEEIENVEQFFAELTDKQRDKVENSDVLAEARAEYDRLVTQQAIDQIGTVTMESGDAIDHAEQLYEALSREKRNQVENYQILTAARKEYTRLTTAVQKARDAIDAIGTVTLDSGSKIQEARKAYDALKKDRLESYAADKIATLTSAETAYTQCVGEDIYNTGVALYEKGSYEEALDQFNAVIADYSETTVLSGARKGAADCRIALAQNAYKKNDYYTTMKMLGMVEQEYQSSEEYQKLLTNVQTKLKNARPINGKVIEGDISWGYCYFKVTAGDQDICLKITDTKDTSKYKLMYIRAGQSGQIKVKDGTYSVEWASGEYWYGKEHMFGDETVYKKLSGNTSFSTRYEGNWVYYYYLTLDADDLKGGNTIKADEF